MISLQLEPELGGPAAEPTEAAITNADRLWNTPPSSL